MRTPTLLAAAALLVPLAVGAAPTTSATAAGPIPSTEVTWCDTTTPVPPCIESATLNGTDIRTLAPTWTFMGQAFTIDGSSEVSITLQHNDSAELGSASLDDVVVVHLLTGSLTPRLVTGKGRDTSVARAGSGSAQEVTVTATPVIVSGQCDQSVWPWVCPEYTGTDPETDREWVGYFDFIVSDNNAWSDPAQRDAFYGMNYFTNVAATSVPPEIVPDPTTDADMLLIRLANRHYRSDGTTVVEGHGELRIPNAFLQEVYGIPDPATMTGTSLLPSLSGGGPGTVTAAQESGNTAMLVTYDNVEFSLRKLRVATGTITPTRPTQVSATRTGVHRGFVDFEPSKARGAEVKGYVGRCTPVHGGTTLTARSDNIVRFKGLRRDVMYTCQVRATSKAGPSAWSKGVRMAGSPHS